MKWKSVRRYDGNLTLTVTYIEKIATMRPGRNTVWERQTCKDRDIKTEAFKG